MGKVFGSQGHIRNPGYLNDGTVVELNRSATELMRKAADAAKACKVDPEGIIVEFIPPQDTAEVPAKDGAIPTPGRQISMGDEHGLLPTPLEAVAKLSNPSVEDKESLPTAQLPYAYEQWLVNIKGLSNTVGNIYRQALLLADRTLRQDTPSFSLLTETPEMIRTSFAKLKLGGGLSAARISQFRMAIEYYAQFREAKPSVSSEADVPSRQTKIVVSNEVDQRLHAFEQWLENEQQLAEPTARSYRSAIKTSEEYIQENGLSLVLILGGAEQVSKAAHDLLLRDDYLERNIRQNNRYRAALNQYIRFLNSTGAEGALITEDRKEEVDESPEPESPRWAELIAKRFPRGWKPSYLTLQKIRMYWQADFDEEMSEDDEAITRHVMNSCVVYEGTAYAPESVLTEEAREELFTYVDRAFEEGAVKISLSALYNAHTELFSDQCMYDSEMLKAYLLFAGQEHCIVEGDHIVRERGAQFDISQALYDLYMEAGMPISFAEVYKRFPHEDHRSLIDRVKADRRFVYDHMEDGWAFWFAMDLLDLSNSELEAIVQIIEAEIAEKQFMTSSELRSAIEAQMPDLYERFGGFSWIGCRDSIARKLGHRFYFHGAIISRPGREMLAGDVFREYARRHAPLKVDQLWQLCGDMSSTMTIRWESVFEVASRISATDIVPNAWLHFDVEAIDRVLGTFMDEDYLPLSGVTSFTMFPDCGVPWNAYVLEMYVYQFSRRYRLEHTGFAATGLAGVIVRKDSRFQSMDDMVVDLLRRKPELQTKSAALNYLVDHGWQVRKRYDNLDELLARAAKMRKEGQ